MKVSTEKGGSPVHEKFYYKFKKSKMKYVKFYLNYARPLAKSKYNSITDSEKVL